MPGTLTLDGLESSSSAVRSTRSWSRSRTAGRLMGKRVTGASFLDQVARDGMHACAYLLTVDVDMTPLPGYRMASWATGYQDSMPCPTGRRSGRSVAREDGARPLRLEDEHHRPIEASPRRILQRQVERAASSATAPTSPRSSSSSSPGLLRDRRAGSATPPPADRLVREDSTYCRHQGGVRPPRHPQRHAGRRRPGESSKGEWSAGQQEINLRYGVPCPPPTITSSTRRRQGDRAREGRQHHLHGEIRHGPGGLELSTSTRAVGQGRRRNLFHERQAPTLGALRPVGGRADRVARASWRGSTRPTSTLTSATGGTFAPTRIAWRSTTAPPASARARGAVAAGRESHPGRRRARTRLRRDHRRGAPWHREEA